MALYKRAAHLSVQLKHHLFDTLYHAVALENDATLVTADDAYFAKAYRLGNIKLLTSFAGKLTAFAAGVFHRQRLAFLERSPYNSGKLTPLAGA